MLTQNKVQSVLFFASIYGLLSFSSGAPTQPNRSRSSKHQMSVPLFVTTVCLDWVDNFWEFLTLGENGPASRTDFRRLFNYMDNDASGTVTRQQFVDVWRPQTLMTVADSNTVFDRWATMNNDTGDPTNISLSNWEGVFNYYEPDEFDVIHKSVWTDKWREDLKEFPNRGCPERTVGGKDMTDDSSSICRT